MAPTAQRESLDEAARRLMTSNSNGTYSVRIPAEGNRIVTVPEEGNARVIAMAAAAQQRLAAMDSAA